MATERAASHRTPPAAASGSARRQRATFLRLVGHAALGALLLGAATTAAALVAAWHPGFAEAAWQAVGGRDAGAAERAHRRLEELHRAGRMPEAVLAAEEFFRLVPLPHPSDAFGERFRRALELQLAAAEKAGDAAARTAAARRALVFDPRDSRLALQSGRALATAGLAAEAEMALRTAFAIRPVSPQILTALTSLPGLDEDTRHTLRARHHEALALVMVLPAWMHGDLVVPGTATTAFPADLELDRVVRLGGPVETGPSGAYLVLPAVAELEVAVVSARFVGTDGTTVALEPSPQSGLVPASEGYHRIVPPPDQPDAPAVIGLTPAASLPQAGRIEVEIASRPSPAVAAVLRQFGRWGHPGIKAAAAE
jgi:hypothetical protein